jgi:hypothetical protein
MVTNRKRFRVGGRPVDRTLCGLCAVASTRLFVALREKGFYPKFAVYSDQPASDYAHVYILVDSYIVDVTATQIHPSCRAVEIRRVGGDLPFREWNLAKCVILHSVRALTKFQLATDWPRDQVGFRNAARITRRTN